MKRFNITTPVLFAPPNPAKTVGSIAAASTVPTFSAFFSSYFVGQSYDVSNPDCGKMLEGMKKCYENHQKSGNPHEACQYYVDGFKRMTCSA
mmetsp:Transcript_41949/g.30207  ORF Transcript_41949/g.30207 Transcript_41949/m.30207 type:complete len:92 (-) Transcript_41949:91-366(-)